MNYLIGSASCGSAGARQRKSPGRWACRPRAVAPLIRAAAATRPPSEPRLLGCWISHGWAAGLSVTGHPEWPGAEESTDTGMSGLVTVVVAREAGGATTVCSYLVDPWCLGVKDATGPDGVEQRKLPRLLNQFYQAHYRPPVQVPLDLAQHMVLGAVGYARTLGFKPHPDFAAAAAHLGEWGGSSDITFGRDGMPVYIQGPYDNSARILRTLRKSVGREGFHFVSVLA